MMHPSCFLSVRLLGTPNEEMWPGVTKLPNWHVYPQWKPSKLQTLVPGLDADGYDLLEVSIDPAMICKCVCSGCYYCTAW